MKEAKFLTILFIFIFSSAISGQEPNWHLKLKQTQPLNSSREDVEKAFDFPKISTTFVDEGIEAVFYDTFEGKLSVEYSTGKCSAEKNEGYDVEKSIVLLIIFFRTKKLISPNLKLIKVCYIKREMGMTRRGIILIRIWALTMLFKVERLST